MSRVLINDRACSFARSSTVRDDLSVSLAGVVNKTHLTSWFRFESSNLRLSPDSWQVQLLLTGPKEMYSPTTCGDRKNRAGFYGLRFSSASWARWRFASNEGPR